MTYALVTGQSVCTTSGTNATTALASLPSAPTNNNLVVVATVNCAAATANSVSDGGSTSYAKQKEVQNGNATMSIWAGIANAGTANFTVTWSAKLNGQKETAIVEFSGAPTTVTLDGTPGSASGSASDTDPARTGTVATSNPNSVVVGGVCYLAGLGSEPVLGAGWTRIGTYNNNREYAAYKIETATESAGTNMATSSSRTWVGAVVAFAPPSSRVPRGITNHANPGIF